MIMNEKWLLIPGNNLQNQIEFSFSIANNETTFKNACKKPKKSNNYKYFVYERLNG